MAEQYFGGTATGKKALSLDGYFSVDTGLNSTLGEDLEKFVERFKERIGKDVKVSLLHSPALRAPVLLCVKEERAFGHLIEAGITKPLTTRLLNSGGRMIERQETASDIVDKTFTDHVTAFLTKTYGQKKEIKLVGVSVVPKTADLKNDNVTGYCVAYANLALLNNDASMRAKDINDSNFKLINTFSFNPDSVIENAFGIPLASDFQIKTKAVKKNSKRNNITSSPNEDNDELTLSNVNGRVDVFYQPKRSGFMSSHSNVLFGGQQTPEAGYIGLVVLNDITGISEDGRGRETLLTQLIGIASASRLASNQNFQRVWKPQPGETNTKANPGLVGLEHNVFNDMNYEGQEIKVHHGISKPNDNEMALSQLVGAYFHKTAMIVLEVESHGPNSFIQNKFVKAANDDKSAIAEIIEELNFFTENKFGELFKGTKIAAIKPVATHSGYYIGDDNQSRIDIASIDHLRKLDSYGLEPASMYVLAPSPEKNDFGNLHKRYELLKSIAPSFRQTGWKYQVFLYPAFVQAVVKSFSEAGLRMGTENLESSVDFVNGDVLTSVLGDLDTGIDMDNLFSDSILDSGNSILDNDVLDLDIL